MPRPLMCDPELFAKDLSGKRYVVTGANSGIGFEVTKQLARQSAEIVLGCRRPDEGEKAAAEIREDAPEAELEVRELDLGSLDSVRAFAEAFTADHDRLHGLLNNAGVMNTDAGTTEDGFELQLGINHLGHFLLTELLLDTLQASAPARIVNVSSCFHDVAQGREGEIHFDDLHFQDRDYDGWKAYAQSKLANVLHAKELAKRLEGTGVSAVSVHPGWVRTNLIRHTMPTFVQDYLLRPVLGLMGMIGPWEGAQTSLHALLADDVDSGAYYSQRGIYRDKAKNRGGWPMASPNPQAHDEEVADRLYEKSRELVGLA